MKAISLWQPWASAIANGVKKNETRGWCRPSLVGQDLAICASKRKSSQGELPLGCVVCVVTVAAFLPTEHKYLANLSAAEREWGDYRSGRYAWLLTNVRPLKTPVPVTGRQGVFNLLPDVEKLVRAQL